MKDEKEHDEIWFGSLSEFWFYYCVFASLRDIDSSRKGAKAQRFKTWGVRKAWLAQRYGCMHELDVIRLKVVIQGRLGDALATYD